MVELTKYEESLLPLAVAYLDKKSDKPPTLAAFSSYLKCGWATGRRLLSHIQEKNLLKNSGADIFNEITKDTWEISMPRTRIHTLDELLKFCEVDLELWEVERFIVNKWEMGYIASSHQTKNVTKKTEETNKQYTADAEPLYQVKAFLRRKKFTDLEHAVREHAKLLARVERLQLELNAARSHTRVLARNHAGWDGFLTEIKDFAQAFGDLQLPYEKITAMKSQLANPVSEGHTEDAVALWSDQHFGDRIRREDTSGFPEYDLNISGARWGYTVDKTKRILSLHRAAYPINRLYIWVGGDVANGVLHDAPNSNELFLPAQVHFAYHMLKFGIEDLLTLTEPDENGVKVIDDIELLFSVGNHTRLDEKMPHKYQAQRTLDWLIYQFLIERFSGNPKVIVKQDMSPFIFETIRGHRHLFAHGLQVGFKNRPERQNSAISNFLSTIRSLFDSPEWRKVNKLEGATFDRACIGDIHIPLRYPRFISNGSLNGQNELGVNWGLEPIPASQWLWGVSKSHQETWHYEVESTKVQRQLKYRNKYAIFAEEYMSRFGRGASE